MTQSRQTTNLPDALISLATIMTIVRETTEASLNAGLFIGSPKAVFNEPIRAAMKLAKALEDTLTDIVLDMMALESQGFGITLPPKHGGPPSQN